MAGETIFDLHTPGSNDRMIADTDGDVHDPVPERMLRSGIPLPDISEPQVIRHYTALSRMNFGVDTAMYPLGSCTMKHNPRIGETAARLDNIAGLHPMTEEDSAQGTLSILYELGEYLKELTGMDGVTLCPAAGSHGELSGVMMISRYFQMKGEKRSVVLVPDTAHGTNPASVAMCGFTVREIQSDPLGNVDVDSLAKALDGDVAAMMLTCPNTLGLFDSRMNQIAKMVHDNGSILYGDGANFNALVGRVKPGDLGFDVMHLNLHKTFSTPHGGGGPGAGPVCVKSELEPFLPLPVITRVGDHYTLSTDRPESIGRIHSFYGNVLVCLRAYAYIRMMGNQGLRRVSGDAVLNANYLLHHLSSTYDVPYRRSCMHEFVLSDRGMPEGITTADIAKRLLDYGFHAPTIYFPLLVHGAIMIEPTETESKATLDRFIEAMKAIRAEGEHDPDRVRNAPHTTPVRRVDALTAARKPVITWDQAKRENPAG